MDRYITVHRPGRIIVVIVVIVVVVVIIIAMAADNAKSLFKVGLLT